MYTRAFERFSYNRNTGNEDYEIIFISDYGFDWFVNDERVRSGLVENIDDDIASLLDEGFEEVDVDYNEYLSKHDR